MTVVAAWARDGVVTMAADSCTNYQGTHILGARKIRRLRAGDREMLLSASGSGAMPGLLEAHWRLDNAPDPSSDRDVLAWATAAAQAATEILAGTTPPITESDGQSTTIDGALLVGYAGRLIYMFTHQAVIVPTGVAALGVGADMAIGALHASSKRDPRKRTADAVELACRYHPGCRVGPDGPQIEQLGAR